VNEDAQVAEYLAFLETELAKAFEAPPMTPHQKAAALTDLLNAKSKALGEGTEYTLTGVDGGMAHFDVKQTLPPVFVIDINLPKH
jgi:hypothetical protein